MRTMCSVGIACMATVGMLGSPGQVSAQELKGNGNLIDSGGDKISFMIEDLGGNNANTVFVLKVDNHITWWKSLDLFKTNQNGDLLRVFRLETKDDKKQASVVVLAGDTKGMKQLEVWKGGFAGLGAKVVQIKFDGTSLVGKRITITVHRD